VNLAHRSQADEERLERRQDASASRPQHRARSRSGAWRGRHYFRLPTPESTVPPALRWPVARETASRPALPLT
jgi:hypothetical protein